MAKITPAERRHRDYLRRRGLKVGQAYESRLIRLRRQEVRRVLDLCNNYDDPQMAAAVVRDNLDESRYLPQWWEGLTLAAGVPMAKSTARDLNKVKAAAEETIWTHSLRDYARKRAGENITIVQGTLRDALCGIIAEELEGELGISVEELTKRIYKRYSSQLLKWQCRRIAQTECMIGMAEAGAEAAGTLDVKFTKVWCCSGLGNTRETHLQMDGVEVDEMELFTLPDGAIMAYPHDNAYNPPAAEIINCACDVLRRPK